MLENVNLVTLTQEALERLGPQFMEAGIEVRLTAIEQPVGPWDPARIDQVITNILRLFTVNGG